LEAQETTFDAFVRVGIAESWFECGVMIGGLCCLWESVEWGIWRVLGIILD
jgi:F420-0:gamma-glutamyl ligase-like protein